MATYTLNGQTLNTAGPVPVGGTMLNAQGQPAFGPQTTQAAPLDPNAQSGHSAAYLQANPQYNQTAAQLQANAANLTPGTTPTPTPTTSSNPYLDQVMALQKLSPAEVDAQTQLNTLQSNATQGQFNVSQQPIAQGFISGQQAAMQTQANIAQMPLQQKLALAQNQRAASLDAAKTALDYSLKQQELSKPVFGYPGQSGYQLNPTTNKYEPLATSAQPGGAITGSINPATGLKSDASTNDILGYLGKNGIDPSRYDIAGLIAAVRSGSTAQDIISGRANLAGAKAAATVHSQMITNPVTGAQYTFTPTVGNGKNNSTPALLGGFPNMQAVKDFQTAHGLVVDGIVGPKTKAAMAAAGMDIPTTTSSKPNILGPVVSNQTSQTAPATLPTPTNFTQKAFAQDFTSGGLSDRINAQNTAVGHLTAAYDLAQKMQNWSLQPGNAGKNWLATKEGKAAVDNYKLAHQFSSSEADAAYGIGSAGERNVTAALGGADSSPEQLKGFVQTSGALLSSKILSNIQQYKTAYGANAPINLDWFIAPQNRAQLSQIGIQIHQNGNQVGAYQLQKDGSYKQI